MPAAESHTVERYRSLNLADWGVILSVTVVAVLWQLSVNNSFTSKLTGALVFGGISLGIGMYLFRLIRGQ
jgi:hypothetical protein